MSSQPRKIALFAVCAWCNNVLGTSIAASMGEEALTTHGLCADCLRRIRLQGNRRYLGEIRGEPPPLAD
jgi:hypothetical protein